MARELDEQVKVFEPRHRLMQAPDLHLISIRMNFT